MEDLYSGVAVRPAVVINLQKTDKKQIKIKSAVRVIQSVPLSLCAVVNVTPRAV